LVYSAIPRSSGIADIVASVAKVPSAQVNPASRQTLERGNSDMSQDSETTLPEHDLLRHTAQIVAAYVSHNARPSAELAGLIEDVHAALAVLQQPAAESQPPAGRPAVSIAKSVTPDYIVCLEDGKKLKMLKRHLRGLGMTPDQYRAKWHLPQDYPMVAPNYAKWRSAFAKRAGFGRTGASV
jgi:predicted transcriptional regulator